MSELTSGKPASAADSLAVARALGSLIKHDLVIRLLNPFTISILVVMPPFLMMFFHPLASAMVVDGDPLVSGNLVAPGILSVFAFYISGILGFSILEDIDWNTWDRMRQLVGRPQLLIASKLMSAGVLGLLQVVVLGLLGFAFFDYPSAGARLAPAMAVGVIFTLFVLAMGLFFAVIARTLEHLTILVNAAAVGIGTLGGGLIPNRLLPTWAQALAPVTPVYWVMEAYERVGNPARPLSAALVPIGVVLVQTTVVFAAAMAIQSRRPFSVRT